MKNLCQVERTEQHPNLIYLTACWATTGPDSSAAGNTIVKLVNSRMAAIGSWCHLLGGAFDGFSPLCDDLQPHGDVYGPNKGKVLKRLWALKKEIQPLLWEDGANRRSIFGIS